MEPWRSSVLPQASRVPSTRRTWQAWNSVSTNDALVAYKVVGGPDSQTVVPDLAASIPLSPDGGRTWTFQLRSGITYSNGAPVRPSDVLGSFERALSKGANL